MVHTHPGPFPPDEGQLGSPELNIASSHVLNITIRSRPLRPNAVEEKRHNSYNEDENYSDGAVGSEAPQVSPASPWSWDSGSEVPVLNLYAQQAYGQHPYDAQHPYNHPLSGFSNHMAMSAPLGQWGQMGFEPGQDDNMNTVAEQGQTWFTAAPPANTAAGAGAGVAHPLRGNGEQQIAGQVYANSGNGEAQRQAAERSVLAQFKAFSAGESERLAIRTRQHEQRRRAAQRSDLKSFSQNLKLNTPVPKDMLPLMGRGKARQDEIVAKSKAAMEEWEAAREKEKLVPPEYDSANGARGSFHSSLE